MSQASAVTQATDTRELIVESAYACFRRQGLQKTTIVDIASRRQRLPQHHLRVLQ